MNFLKKLFSSGGAQQRYFVYHVKCKRCGEVIEGRIDTTNDLSVEYEGSREIYHARKVLIGDGSKHCYQQIEVALIFNRDRDLLEKSVENGVFVDG